MAKKKPAIQQEADPLHFYYDRDDTVINGAGNLLNPNVMIGILRGEEKRGSSFTLLSAGGSEMGADPCIRDLKDAGVVFKGNVLATVNDLPIHDNYTVGDSSAFVSFATGKVTVEHAEDNQFKEIEAYSLQLLSLIFKIRKDKEKITPADDYIQFTIGNQTLRVPNDMKLSLTIGEASVSIELSKFIPAMTKPYHGKFFAALPHLLLSRKTLPNDALMAIGISVKAPKNFTVVPAQHIIITDDHKDYAGDFETVGCRFIEADTLSRTAAERDDATLVGNTYLEKLLTVRHPNEPKPNEPNHRKLAQQIVRINNFLEKTKEDNASMALEGIFSKFHQAIVNPNDLQSKFQEINKEDKAWVADAGAVLQNLVERFVLEDPQTLAFLNSRPLSENFNKEELNSYLATYLELKIKHLANTPDVSPFADKTIDTRSDNTVRTYLELLSNLLGNKRGIQSEFTKANCDALLSLSRSITDAEGSISPFNEPWKQYVQMVRELTSDSRKKVAILAYLADIQPHLKTMESLSELVKTADLTHEKTNGKNRALFKRMLKDLMPANKDYHIRKIKNLENIQGITSNLTVLKEVITPLLGGADPSAQNLFKKLLDDSLSGNTKDQAASENFFSNNIEYIKKLESIKNTITSIQAEGVSNALTWNAYRELVSDFCKKDSREDAKKKIDAIRERIGDIEGQIKYIKEQEETQQNNIRVITAKITEINKEKALQSVQEAMEGIRLLDRFAGDLNEKDLQEQIKAFLDFVSQNTVNEITTFNPKDFINRVDAISTSWESVKKSNQFNVWYGEDKNEDLFNTYNSKMNGLFYIKTFPEEKIGVNLHERISPPSLDGVITHFKKIKESSRFRNCRTLLGFDMANLLLTPNLERLDFSLTAEEPKFQSGYNFSSSIQYYRDDVENQINSMKQAVGEQSMLSFENQCKKFGVEVQPEQAPDEAKSEKQIITEIERFLRVWENASTLLKFAPNLNSTLKQDKEFIYGWTFLLEKINQKNPVVLLLLDNYDISHAIDNLSSPQQATAFLQSFEKKYLNTVIPEINAFRDKGDFTSAYALIALNQKSLSHTGRNVKQMLDDQVKAHLKQCKEKKAELYPAFSESLPTNSLKDQLHCQVAFYATIFVAQQANTRQFTLFGKKNTVVKEDPFQKCIQGIIDAYTNTSGCDKEATIKELNNRLKARGVPVTIAISNASDDEQRNYSNR
ncbi:MAG: hypothetical protein WC785_07315 [Tatlockia sp.]|jgi:hypothetical protein